jgi:Dienelactone hydrolase family
MFLPSSGDPLKQAHAPALAVTSTATAVRVWGRQDPHVPLEGRILIRHRLEEAGVVYQWHEFNAQHAFLRDEGPRYDPALAWHCYGLVLELFHRKLGQGDLSRLRVRRKTPGGEIPPESVRGLADKSSLGEKHTRLPFRRPAEPRPFAALRRRHRVYRDSLAGGCGFEPPYG